MSFMALYIFVRLFWRVRETLVKQPPGTHRFHLWMPDLHMCRQGRNGAEIVVPSMATRWQAHYINSTCTYSQVPNRRADQNIRSGWHISSKWYKVRAVYKVRVTRCSASLNIRSGLQIIFDLIFLQKQVFDKDWFSSCSMWIMTAIYTEINDKVPINGR